MAHLTRILRYINYLIAIAAVALLGAVWWYAWRPLPKPRAQSRRLSPRRSRWTAMRWGRRTSRRPLKRTRSSRKATSPRRTGCFRWTRSGGWPPACSLKWSVRRALESDRDMRRLRMRRIAEAAYPLLPARDRAALAAYARGVQPASSAPTSTACRSSSPCSISTASLERGGYPARRLNMYPHADHYVARRVDQAQHACRWRRGQSEFSVPGARGGEVQPGSNAWAIAGARTASGSPSSPMTCTSRFSARRVVHGAPAGAGAERGRRHAAGHARA